MDEGRKTSLRLTQGQKLIPRDINEALGKMPPSATDLEEAVLGALMLEAKVVDPTLLFLKAEHFYKDAHREIFQAIVNLRKANQPVDMRTVIHQLRTEGKTELVGGTYVIPELTAKVSSAANIEFHARVVMEMAMKRKLIELASKIHLDAYDDTTDIFVLLDQVGEDLKFLEERHTTNSGPERIKKLWEKYGITLKPVRPNTLIRIGDADVCTVGNISLLVGKKKSRKSLLTVQLLSLFLSEKFHNEADIAIFDTEQEEYDVWATRDRIYRLTGKYVSIFCLRGLSPKERRDFIQQTVTHWESKLVIGVIDGIRDCMSNINDPDESTEVMSWLMKMNVETKIHFINVLHLNKTDGNARGHIGSELLNKAEVTIEVEYDEKTGYSSVKCESSRRKPFDPFSFTHSPEGLPMLVDNPIGGKVVSHNERLHKLKFCFQDGDQHYKSLLEQIQDNFGVGLSKARWILKEFQQQGVIMKFGKDKSPDAIYKLMIHIGDLPETKPEPEIKVDPDKGHPFDELQLEF